MDALKEANDWGQPLDETKMVKRELNDKTSLIPAMHAMNIYNEESSERIFTGEARGRFICLRSLRRNDKITTG